MVKTQAHMMLRATPQWTALKRCTLPITGLRVVDTIVTEMAYIRVTQSGLVLEEIAPGLTVEEVQQATEAPLIASPDLKTMAF